MTKSEGLGIFRPEEGPLALTFLVLSGTSLMCVASAIDPLRAANRVTGKTAFTWKLVSADGRQPVTTAGLAIAVSGRFDPAEQTDVLAAIGGFGTRDDATPGLVSGLRRASARARAVGGIEAGTWLLARAGLLDGHAATTHWEDFEDFSAAFPQVDVRPDRFLIDGKVFSAGGASPAFDLMLHLVRTRLGAAAALDVASVFVYDQTRAASEAQPAVSLGRLDVSDPRLAHAIRLMEGRIDRPLTVAAIARRVGTSTRTLEKSFAAALGQTPGAYALRLRLAAARRLVLDTREPMTAIAARTGFGSAASFSRAFSGAFGSAPSRLRETVKPDTAP